MTYWRTMWVGYGLVAVVNVVVLRAADAPVLVTVALLVVGAACLRVLQGREQ